MKSGQKKDELFKKHPETGRNTRQTMIKLIACDNKDLAIFLTVFSVLCDIF
jgi:hypothetical protein